MANSCIARFKGEAAKQQKIHEKKYPNSLPILLPDPDKNEEILKQLWALYDVGTCYFILGQVCEKQADMFDRRSDNINEIRKFYKEAIKYYDIVINNYSGAQCFDPGGPWYWSVKKGAMRRVDIITDNKLTY